MGESPWKFESSRPHQTSEPVAGMLRALVVSRSKLDRYERLIPEPGVILTPSIDGPILRPLR